MSENPAASSPQASHAAGGMPRRGFLGLIARAVTGSWLAVGFAALALSHVLGCLGLARFMFTNVVVAEPHKFKAGRPDDLGPGQVEAKFVARFGAWIVRHEYRGQPQVFALRAVCTHLGCTPIWQEGEQKFKCPCHGSGFHKDGTNFEGPAPRALDRYAIRLTDDGQLEVDKDRMFREEAGQWQDPASFVRGI